MSLITAIHTLHFYVHRNTSLYMITMLTSDQLNCYCRLIWLILLMISAISVNGSMDHEDENSASVLFQWSAGFGRHFEAIRCATDQASEDPSYSLVDIYPEMQGLYQELKLRRLSWSECDSSWFRDRSVVKAIESTLLRSEHRSSISRELTRIFFPLVCV